MLGNVEQIPDPGQLSAEEKAKLFKKGMEAIACNRRISICLAGRVEDAWRILLQ
jgi:hypothetical protein